MSDTDSSRVNINKSFWPNTVHGLFRVCLITIGTFYFRNIIYPTWVADFELYANREVEDWFWAHDWTDNLLEFSVAVAMGMIALAFYALTQTVVIVLILLTKRGERGWRAWRRDNGWFLLGLAIFATLTAIRFFIDINLTSEAFKFASVTLREISLYYELPSVVANRVEGLGSKLWLTTMIFPLATVFIATLIGLTFRWRHTPYSRWKVMKTIGQIIRCIPRPI